MRTGSPALEGIEYGEYGRREDGLTWLLYSKQFQCFSNSERQFSRSLVILSGGNSRHEDVA